jgi:sporulation protein YlmC with PRC-barrel domain
MLRSMHDLKSYGIRATDGDIGHVKDFYFSDQEWVVRYLVVDTSVWLPNRKVLISPMFISKPNWRDKMLQVSITKNQVKHSPDIDTDKPVSRQEEGSYYRYYDYPYYWGGAELWGENAYPYATPDTQVGRQPERAQHGRGAAGRATLPEPDAEPSDRHLRSGKEVIGYHIEATDGEIGHVDDLLVDEDTWAIRYLIVKTSSWWGGHEVLIVPQWITGVSLPDNQVQVSLTRKQVKDAPVYSSATELDRKQEEAIYSHYGRDGYWTATTRHQVIAPQRTNIL